MKKTKSVRTVSLIGAALALASACVCPTVFIRWIVPLYAVCVAAETAATFLLFFALFSAKGKEKPAVPAAVGAAVYCAVLFGLTFAVNNLIFGAVAPWGSVLVNAVLNFCFRLALVLRIRRHAGEAFRPGAPVCAALLAIGLVVSVIAALPNVKATGFIVLDTPARYEARMETADVYENTLETAVPMTDVYEKIDAHLRAPLPAGKTEKKVLVLGWDGCRADAAVMPHPAVDLLLEEGGRAQIAYCGGANYPAPITQDTSTAPGWTSMLTGAWAEIHGIDGNGNGMKEGVKTLLSTAIEDGLIGSSAFYFSWDGHLTTYEKEIAYDAAQGLRAVWQCTDGDGGTEAAALADLQQADCSDFIFTIFEYCDHNGHYYGFWNDTPEYAEAYRKSNAAGVNLIGAVRARPTYETEDWLILITSDHGGYVRGHGGSTLMERMMFIVTNKP